MIKSNRSDANGMDLEFSSGLRLITSYDSIFGVQPPDPGAQSVLDALAQHVYNQMEAAGMSKRIRVNQLPSDDPDRQADPNNWPFHFWDDSQPGPTDLVSHPYRVTVTWDGERYQYSFKSNIPVIS